jgi:hypothetical protein
MLILQVAKVILNIVVSAISNTGIGISNVFAFSSISA